MTTAAERRKQLAALEADEGWTPPSRSAGQAKWWPEKFDLAAQKKKEKELEEIRRAQKDAEIAAARERAKAEAERIEEIVGADPSVVKWRKALEKEQKALDALQAELDTVEGQIAELEGESTAPLFNVKLNDLLKVAKEKGGHAELPALTAVRDELQRRLSIQQEAVSETQSELSYYIRSALHRHIDGLIAETRPHLESLAILLKNIREGEQWVGERGGIRQVFLSARVSNVIQSVAERFDEELEEIRIGSETY